MKTILEVKNLDVSFGEEHKPILENVSFQVMEGQLISLIGLNGTGKTTLLKTIVGLIKPQSGEVIKHTKNIFYIPQKVDLDTSFPFTVREFCQLFGAKGYHSYLEKTGTDKLLDQDVGNLSGGEFQRVMIALALSKKPELLPLEEPASGIDITGEESFYKLISEISKEEKLAIILVSHDLHLVMKNTDQVLCLAGHLCCIGAPAEVKKNAEFQEIFGKHLQPYEHSHDHIH